MDEYVELNLNFVRALQTGNPDGALFFATEIEKKFPNHPNMVAFREVLAQHAASLQARRGSNGGGPASTSAAAANSSDEDDEDEEEEEGEEEEGSDDEEGSEEDEGESGVKPSQVSSKNKSLPTPQPPPKAAKMPSAAPTQQAPKSPPPTAKHPAGGGTAAAKNLKAPSVRDFVTLHPSRELDDEVDRMFDDADRQIEAELQRLQLAKHASKKKP